MRPLLVDLFCKQGGAGAGYHRAGFDVLGVDIEPQPRYPFRFVQADALSFLEGLRVGGHGQVAAVHASPPCQRYSVATQPGQRAACPDLVGPVRDLLGQLGVPWVIENVPGAPMRADIVCCGCMFTETPRLKRERWFETSWRAFEFRQPCQHSGPVVSVCGHGRNRTTGPGLKGTAAEWAEAMGIGWMSRRGLNQAVPPAYTEHVGRQLMRRVAGSTQLLRMVNMGCTGL